MSEDELRAKLQAGRPVALTSGEAEALRRALREAVATTLAVPPEEVDDSALVFDELGLDSIDVFDVLDQLGERYEVAVTLEELPENLLRGGDATTFRDFAEALVAYFGSAPGGRVAE